MLEDEKKAGPGRARRAIAAVAKSAGVLCTFAIAAAGGAILHIGLPAPRRFIVATVNDVLSDMFKGKIVLRDLGGLDLGGVRGVEGDVFDPEGVRVIAAHDVGLRFGLRELVTSLVSGKALEIDLSDVRVGALEVVLGVDDKGDLGLVRAFDAKVPTPADPNAAPVRVHVKSIEVAHVHASGVPAKGAPKLDVDLDDLRAGLDLDEHATKIDVDGVAITSRGMDGRDPTGLLSAHAALPATEKNGKMNVEAAFIGAVGAIPVILDASMKDDRVRARVDVPAATAEALHAAAPDVVNVKAPASLHAEVNGPLGELVAYVDATVGPGRVRATAVASVPHDDVKDTRAHVVVDVDGVDASVLAEGAPVTRANAGLEARIALHDGGRMEGTFALEVREGEAAGQRVPPVHLAGAFTEQSVTAGGSVDEPGAEADLWIAAQTKEGKTTPSLLLAEVAAKVDLQKLERVKGIGRGVVDADVMGRFDLDDQAMHADVTAKVAGFDNGQVRLGYGDVKATVDGTPAAPRFTAHVAGGRLVAGGYTFTKTGASASGTPTRMTVAANVVGDANAPTASAKASLDLSHGVGIYGAKIAVAHARERVDIAVKSARIDGGVVAVDGLHLEGVGGKLDASVRLAGKRIKAKATAADIELARVALLLERPDVHVEGCVGLDVDVTTDGRRANGKVQVDAVRLASGTFRDGEAHVGATFDGQQVGAELLASLGTAGRVIVRATDVKLAGAVTDARAWKDATGHVGVVGVVDVHRALAVAGEDIAPYEGAGFVSLAAGVQRDKKTDLPEVGFDVRTAGFSLSAKREKKVATTGEVTLEPPAWHIEGTDGRLEAHVQPEAGGAHVAFSLDDHTGKLLGASVDLRAPIAALLGGRVTPQQAVDQAKVTAVFDVPKRDLETLPPFLRQRIPARGKVAVHAEVSGDAKAPKVSVTLHGERIVHTDATKRARPADVDLVASYDGAHGDVKATIGFDGKAAIDATAKLDATIAALQGEAGAAPWVASADVKLDAFPLATVAAFTGQRVRGSATGTLSLNDLHRDAKLGVDVSFKDLVLDRARLPQARAVVVAQDGKLTADVQMLQTDGYGALTAKGAMAWGDRLAPELDKKSPLDVRLLAKRLDIAAAQPFVAAVMPEIGGRLDANVTAHVDPSFANGKVDGAIALRDGVFEIPALGERLHGVGAYVTLSEQGVVKLDHFQALGPTGRVLAAASARFDGFALRNAAAKVTIPEGEALPIAIQGVPMGRAYGDIGINAALSPDGNRVGVNVSVPQMHVELPQSTGHAVQDLARDAHVRIGTYDGGTQFASVAMGPPEKVEAKSAAASLLHVAVALGQVTVRRDTTLNVTVSGKPAFDVGDQTRASGSLHIARGSLDVQGKKFTIEHGIVTFAGDPSQPQIVATAGWDAPDGTRVYADFAGTPKTGKLKLRAEPSRTQDEIVSLILFGSTDGQFGASTPGGADESTVAKGAGVAGGVVTQGVNKAISGVTKVDVQTRVDTSDSDNPKPELVVQISPTVSAQVSYALGVPPPGQNPDKTTVTLDWRFHRSWSVDASLGDEGSTAVDLLWRKRY